MRRKTFVLSLALAPVVAAIPRYSQAQSAINRIEKELNRKLWPTRAPL